MSDRPSVIRRTGGADLGPEEKWSVADVRLFVATIALLGAGVIVGVLIVRMY